MEKGWLFLGPALPRARCMTTPRCRPASLACRLNVVARHVRANTRVGTRTVRMLGNAPRLALKAYLCRLANTRGVNGAGGRREEGDARSPLQGFRFGSADAHFSSRRTHHLADLAASIVEDLTKSKVSEELLLDARCNSIRTYP